MRGELEESTMNPGTKVIVKGMPRIGPFLPVPPRRAIIAKWTKVNGPRGGDISPETGWHIVQFPDGRRVCIHQDRLEVRA